MRRGFLLIWTLVTAAIAGVTGFLSYQAGYASGLATKIPEGAAGAAPYWAYGFHPFLFGFGLFPLFFLIVLIVLLFAAFGRRRRWGGGWGYPGGPYQGGGQSPMEQRLKEWHDRAHGEQPSNVSTA